MASKYTSEFPGFHALYEVSSVPRPPFKARLALERDEAVAVRRGAAPQSPLVAEWVFGSGKPGAVVPTSSWIFLLSNSALCHLRREDLTGWDAVPVQLRLRTGEPSDVEYYALQFLGRCGPIQAGRSTLVYRSFPAGEFPMCQGLYFEEGTYDGDDFFVPEDRKHVSFVSKRAREALRPFEENLEFTPLDVVQLPPKRR